MAGGSDTAIPALRPRQSMQSCCNLMTRPLREQGLPTAHYPNGSDKRKEEEKKHQYNQWVSHVGRCLFALILCAPVCSIWEPIGSCEELFPFIAEMKWKFGGH